jgi:hypothetical protein
MAPQLYSRGWVDPVQRTRGKWKRKFLGITLKFLYKIWNTTSQAERDSCMKNHRDSSISKHVNGAGSTSGDVRIINANPTKRHSAVLYYTTGYTILYRFYSLNKWWKINVPQRRGICWNISRCKDVKCNTTVCHTSSTGHAALLLLHVCEVGWQSRPSAEAD